jgi:hypothetical protein
VIVHGKGESNIPQWPPFPTLHSHGTN